MAMMLQALRLPLQASHACGVSMGRACALRAFASTTSAALPSAAGGVQTRAVAAAAASASSQAATKSEGSSIAPAIKRRSSSSLKPQVRDPARPKRPATPWISFLADFRKQVTASGAAKLKPTVVMKEASAKWKVLTPFDRQKYEEPYDLAKKEYDIKFKDYVDSGKQDAWKRDPERPKRPLSGYMRYAQEIRPKYADLKMTEQAKKFGAEWKSLSDVQKAPYEQAHATEKEKYDKEMKAYKESGKEDKWKAQVGITGKKVDKKVVAEKLQAEKLKQKAQVAKAKAKAKAEKEKAKLVAAKAKAAEKKVKEAEKAVKKAADSAKKVKAK